MKQTPFKALHFVLAVGALACVAIVGRAVGSPASVFSMLVSAQQIAQKPFQGVVEPAPSTDDFRMMADRAEHSSYELKTQAFRETDQSSQLRDKASQLAAETPVSLRQVHAPASECTSFIHHPHTHAPQPPPPPPPALLLPTLGRV